MSFTEKWAAWHESRETDAARPHGPAALAGTSWLADGLELDVPDVAGRWSIVDGAVIGTGLAGSGYLDAHGGQVGDRVELRSGDELTDGERLLRAFARDDQRALRVFDPAAASRSSLGGIETYEPDERYLVEARFEPTSEQVDVVQADGYVAKRDLGGRLAFELGGARFAVDADIVDAGLQVVFSDSTSGVESYRFRFLTVPAPAADGSTVIDFTRAYLPPCAFSDQFVCPTPAPNNRLTVPVRAGERNAIRATD